MMDESQYMSHNESHIMYIIVKLTFAVYIHAKSMCPLLFLQGDQWIGHDSRDGQSFCIGTIIVLDRF